MARRGSHGVHRRPRVRRRPSRPRPPQQNLRSRHSAIAFVPTRAERRLGAVPPRRPVAGARADRRGPWAPRHLFLGRLFLESPKRHALAVGARARVCIRSEARRIRPAAPRHLPNPPFARRTGAGRAGPAGESSVPQALAFSIQGGHPLAHGKRGRAWRHVVGELRSKVCIPAWAPPCPVVAARGTTRRHHIAEQAELRTKIRRCHTRFTARTCA